MLLFFFWCEINRSFISFRYCKFYVYVVYFLLIVQDFVLFAPAVWIFTYNMALMVLLLAVIVRQQRVARRARRRKQQLREIKEQAQSSQA